MKLKTIITIIDRTDDVNVYRDDLEGGDIENCLEQLEETDFGFVFFEAETTQLVARMKAQKVWTGEHEEGIMAIAPEGMEKELVQGARNQFREFLKPWFDLMVEEIK